MLHCPKVGLGVNVGLGGDFRRGTGRSTTELSWDRIPPSRQLQFHPWGFWLLS